MPKHLLKPTWTKIASVGDNVDAINTGQVIVETARSATAVRGTPLMVDSRYTGNEMRTELFARSLNPGGEITTTISPGRLPEYI